MLRSETSACLRVLVITLLCLPLRGLAQILAAVFLSRACCRSLSRCDAAPPSMIAALAVGCAGTTALRSSLARPQGFSQFSQANERAVRAWACVRSGWWCVNRELSVARESWRTGRLGERGGETRLCSVDMSSALMLLLLLDICTYKNDVYLCPSVLYTSVSLHIGRMGDQFRSAGKTRRDYHCRADTRTGRLQGCRW